MVAEAATVYQGLVAELTADARPRRQHIADSPMHRRLRAVLDKLSPLNLTDPQSPAFAPAGCQTIHDIIRFAHERSMQEMFGLGAMAKDEVISCQAHHPPTPVPPSHRSGGRNQAGIDHLS